MSARKRPGVEFPDLYSLRQGAAPMEARSAESLPNEPGEWQFEPKWDGFRCLAFKEAGAVELRGKSGTSLSRFFPEVVVTLLNVPFDRFVVDGELVIELNGRITFHALQARLHPAASRIRRLSQETPARLILFDMLVGTDGSPVGGLPLAERRSALEAFGEKAAIAGKLIVTPCTRDLIQATQWLDDFNRDGRDGVVAKRLDGQYLSGERAMLKVKRLRTADCVVGGFRYLSGRAEVGSLLLGLYNAQGLLDHVGFTSTIANEERPALTQKLRALHAPPGFTGRAPGGPSRWSTERSGEWEPLRPELVVEVRYDHVTGGRFRHGTKLLRFRPDKPPGQCAIDQILIPPRIPSADE
jgi:ATP-dependent DNA ligase